MSPHTNSFFSNTTGYTGEINLLDDLCREQIKMFGVDVLYMPRLMLNLDKILHESTKSAFELALPMPAYIKSFDGYDNGMEVLSKFGVRNSDEITLVISRSEFQTYYSPFLKSYYNGIEGRSETSELNHLEGEIAARPKEGDLVYFPFDDGIFEIKYVNFDVPFFQLGKGYVFELQCEKFEYSGETLDTGYDKIDDTSEEADYYRLELQFKDTGTGTFIFHEKVLMYNLTDYTIINGGQSIVDFFNQLESGEVVEMYPSLDTGTASDIQFEGQQISFSMYKDPGFTHEVEKIEATAEYWNKNELILTVSDLTDLNPEQKNPVTNDVNVNNFDRVVVVGQTSGAVYYSEKAQTRDKAFDDEKELQREFDQIKIVDFVDESPFGFI